MTRSRLRLTLSLWWGLLLLFLAGCDGSEEFSEALGALVLEFFLLLVGVLLAVAAALFSMVILGGGVVFLSAAIATYTHIRPTPLMRGLATTAGVLLTLLGLLLVVAGFGVPPQDNQGLDILRAAGPRLYAGAVALWLGAWNLLAALKLLRRFTNEEDHMDAAARSLAEHC